MPALRIDNITARHLWLSAQGLATTPTGPLDTLQIIHDLGFVQLDTIQTVMRAHDHILWSRNQNYRPRHLDRLLAKDRAVFEHFTHDASVIPMDFLPFWERQFRRKKTQLDQPGYLKSLPDAQTRAAMKERFRREGSLSTKDFESQTPRPKEVWARPPHKVALDYMWYTGELATCHRINFTKVYALAERVFPGPLTALALPDAEQVDQLCQGALSRMSFGTPGDIQRYWDATTSAETRDWVHSQNLVEVDVEGSDGTWGSALAPGDIEHRIKTLCAPTSRLRILNPFDPAIRDRIRLERLFGFDYRVEMFVPAAKRKWGYYVFPILEGHRFVGRIDLKANRKAGHLAVINFWPEPGVAWPASRHDRLAAELDRLRRFAGLETVVWAR